MINRLFAIGRPKTRSFRLEEDEGKSLRINMGGVIGEGSFSKIYMGLCEEEKVAIKKLTIRNHVTPSKRRLKNFFRVASPQCDPTSTVEEIDNEVALTRICQHRNVVAFLDIFFEPDAVFMVLEFCTCSLDDVWPTSAAGTKEPMECTLALCLLAPIAEALEFVHSKNIVHRDIKAENILITPDGKPKLCDFGIAQRLKVGEEVMCEGEIGTMGYMPPEVYRGEELSTKCDVFSFGILLYSLIAQSLVSYPSFNLIEAENLLPKPDCEESVLVTKVYTIASEAIIENFPTQVAKRAVRLAISCIRLRARDRPTMGALLDTELLEEWAANSRTRTPGSTKNLFEWLLTRFIAPGDQLEAQFQFRKSHFKKNAREFVMTEDQKRFYEKQQQEEERRKKEMDAFVRSEKRKQIQKASRIKKKLLG